MNLSDVYGLINWIEWYVFFYFVVKSCMLVQVLVGTGFWYTFIAVGKLLLFDIKSMLGFVRVIEIVVSTYCIIADRMNNK